VLRVSLGLFLFNTHSYGPEKEKKKKMIQACSSQHHNHCRDGYRRCKWQGDAACSKILWAAPFQTVFEILCFEENYIYGLHLWLCLLNFTRASWMIMTSVPDRQPAAPRRWLQNKSKINHFYRLCELGRWYWTIITADHDMRTWGIPNWSQTDSTWCSGKRSKFLQKGLSRANHPSHPPPLSSQKELPRQLRSEVKIKCA
jgi:hypothetical protein